MINDNNTDNIMTPSTPKPMIMTDFDGVINAFPDDKVMRRGGIGHVNWMKDNDPRKQVYSIDNAYILDMNKTVKVFNKNDLKTYKYRLHWSSDVSNMLANFVRNNYADITWLTTWQPYTAILDDKLNWTGLTETAEWYNADMPLTSQEGKITWIKSWLKNDYNYVLKTNPDIDVNSDDFIRKLTPVIWIDDEMVLNWSINELKALIPAPILFIRPDYRTGINRRQMQEINDWIHNDNRITEELLEPIIWTGENSYFME